MILHFSQRGLTEAWTFTFHSLREWPRTPSRRVQPDAQAKTPAF
jgi:hypothetical protein